MHLRNRHSEFLEPLVLVAFGKEEFRDLKSVSCAKRTDLWVVCILQGWWGSMHHHGSAHTCSAQAAFQVQAVKVVARERL